MNKQITIILATLMALPLIFAITMYGGDNQTIEFSFETDNCSISQNVTEGISFSNNSNKILIETAINYIGNFSITCYDWKTKGVETRNGGSRLKLPEVITPVNPIEFNTTVNLDNKTILIDTTPEVNESKQIKLNIFQRFWNWLKGLFK